MKRKYEVVIERIESCSVVVEAMTKEQAKEFALAFEERGMIDNYAYGDVCIKVVPISVS